MSDESIFCQALEIADPVQRSEFLDRVCCANGELRREVEQLLAAHEDRNPLDNPAVNIGPTELLQQASEPAPAAVGEHIGPYRLMEQIGEGGFGLVFVAEQQRPVERKVAIKVLKPGMDTRDVVARFEAERQALALMDHPHIAKVFDAGSTENGRPYFVMELVRGIPITEFCDQQKLSPRQRLEIFIQVCHAVQHAHQKGVIHRDIKPSNVLVTMIDGVGVPKVIDFGVAKAVGQKLTEKTLYTKFAQMIGTPLYMSPEQAQMSGVDIDTRTDVYALGVLLYELLTGTTPFDRERFRTAAFDEIRRIIREEDPPRPSTRLTSLGETLSSVCSNRSVEPSRLPGLIRGEIDWIVMKSLEKDRNRRYETANGLARDVQRYLNQEAVEACPPTLSYRIGKAYRKHKAPILTAAAFVSLLLVALSISTYLALTNQRLAREAQQHALQSQRNAESARANAEKAEKEQAKAQQEAAAARAVSDFLFEDLISPLDPWEQPNLRITLREVLENASQRLDGAFREAPQIEADIKLRLGQVFWNLRSYRAANQMLQDAYQIRKEQFGPDNEQTLDALETLLTTSSRSFEDQKTSLANTLVDLRKTTVGNEHPDTLRAQRILLVAQIRELNNLTEPAVAAERWSKIEQHLTSILNKQRQILGNHHQDVSRTLAILGSAVYEPQGRFEEALDIHRQSFEHNRQLHGEAHRETFLARMRICSALAAAKRFDELETEVLQALDQRDSPNFRSYTHLGSDLEDYLMMSYFARGRGDLGIEMYEKYAKRKGEGSRGRLAAAYAKYRDRETHATYAAELLIESEDSESLGALLNAANAYLLLPSQDSALLDKAVRMARKAMELHSQGSKFYWYLTCRGIAEYRVGEYHVAKQLLSDPRIQGANTSYPASRAYLAMTEFQLGNIAEAQSLLAEAKTLIEELPSKHLVFFNWSSIIRAQLALEEAIALIEGQTPASESPTS